MASLGLFAILLLSIVPTISQVLAARAVHGDPASAAHHGSDQGSAHHDHDAGVPCPDGKHGDEWHKCGYCDFLAHTPATGHLAYRPLFDAPLPPALDSRASAESAPPTHFPAAQPRGPPGFLA
jgi:hypothetical protein